MKLLISLDMIIFFNINLGCNLFITLLLVLCCTKSGNSNDDINMNISLSTMSRNDDCFDTTSINMENPISTISGNYDYDDKTSEHLCPICMDVPDKVFCCFGCMNWVCGQCVVRLDTCPICRFDLTSVPMMRNETVERIIRQINN